MSEAAEDSSRPLYLVVGEGADEGGGERVVELLPGDDSDRTPVPHAMPDGDTEVVLAEIVEEEAVLVDQPYEPRASDYLVELRTREVDRQPIIPVWLRSRDDAIAVVRWHVRYQAHVAGFHAFRVPYYYARLVLQSPRGLGKVFVTF